MKKPGIAIVLLLTVSLLAFTFGFYCGRDFNPAPITVSKIAVSSPSPSQSSNHMLININTADAAQLSTLPGIGKTIAQRIIDYRELNGAFQDLDSLLHVEGIGEKTLDSILDFITTGG